MLSLAYHLQYLEKMQKFKAFYNQFIINKSENALAFIYNVLLYSI